MKRQLLWQWMPTIGLTVVSFQLWRVGNLNEMLSCNDNNHTPTGTSTRNDNMDVPAPPPPPVAVKEEDVVRNNKSNDDDDDSGGKNSTVTGTSSKILVRKAAASTKRSVLQKDPSTISRRSNNHKNDDGEDKVGGGDETKTTTDTAASHGDDEDEDDGDVDDDCRLRVDALESTFDRRREARQKSVKRLQKRERTLARHPNHHKHYFDLYEPEAICIAEERIGITKHTAKNRRYDAFGDGPKFICDVDRLRNFDNGSEGSNEKETDDAGTATDKTTKTTKDEEKCLIYSIGSHNKFEFEMAMKERTDCDIYTFDPTLTEAEFQGYKYVTGFRPWGLGADNATTTILGGKYRFQTHSLKAMQQRLGHAHRKIDVFKIDCDGCEYMTMPNVFDDIANGELVIDQILIELHARGSKTDAALRQFFDGVDRAGMRVFHKERNSWGCDGYRCVEYALGGESYLRSVNARFACGGGRREPQKTDTNKNKNKKSNQKNNQKDKTAVEQATT